MGFFKRKSSIADDIYKQAYEKERINQAAARGKADAKKYGGKSKLSGVFDTLGANFAANQKRKGKSGWGLPTADSIYRQQGSFQSSGKRKKKNNGNDWSF